MARTASLSRVKNARLHRSAGPCKWVLSRSESAPAISSARQTWSHCCSLCGLLLRWVRGHTREGVAPHRLRSCFQEGLHNCSGGPCPLVPLQGVGRVAEACHATQSSKSESPHQSFRLAIWRGRVATWAENGNSADHHPSLQQGEGLCQAGAPSSEVRQVAFCATGLRSHCQAGRSSCVWGCHLSRSSSLTPNPANPAGLATAGLANLSA